MFPLPTVGRILSNPEFQEKCPDFVSEVEVALRDIRNQIRAQPYDHHPDIKACAEPRRRHPPPAASAGTVSRAATKTSQGRARNTTPGSKVPPSSPTSHPPLKPGAATSARHASATTANTLGGPSAGRSTTDHGSATEKPAARVPSGSNSASRQAGSQGSRAPSKPERPRVVIPQTDGPQIRQAPGPSTTPSNSLSAASPQASRPSNAIKKTVSSPGAVSPAGRQPSQEGQRLHTGAFVESPAALRSAASFGASQLKFKAQKGTKGPQSPKPTRGSPVESPATPSSAGSSKRRQVS